MATKWEWRKWIKEECELVLERGNRLTYRLSCPYCSMWEWSSLSDPIKAVPQFKTHLQDAHYMRFMQIEAKLDG